MTSHLSKCLQAIASDYKIASLTNSEYFMIEGLQVRISDHHSSDYKGDLAIYHQGRSYVVMSTSTIFKPVEFFLSVDKVIEYIKLYSKFTQTFKGINYLKTTFPTVQNINETKSEMDEFIDNVTQLTLTSKTDQAEVTARRNAVAKYVTPRWHTHSSEYLENKIIEVCTSKSTLSYTLRILDLCMKDN